MQIAIMAYEPKSSHSFRICIDCAHELFSQRVCVYLLSVEKRAEGKRRENEWDTKYTYFAFLISPFQ